MGQTAVSRSTESPAAALVTFDDLKFTFLERVLLVVVEMFEHNLVFGKGPEDLAGVCRIGLFLSGLQAITTCLSTTIHSR